MVARAHAPHLLHGVPVVAARRACLRCRGPRRGGSARTACPPSTRPTPAACRRRPTRSAAVITALSSPWRVVSSRPGRGPRSTKVCGDGADRVTSPSHQRARCSQWVPRSPSKPPPERSTSKRHEYSDPRGIAGEVAKVQVVRPAHVAVLDERLDPPVRRHPAVRERHHRHEAGGLRRVDHRRGLRRRDSATGFSHSTWRPRSAAAMHDRRDACRWATPRSRRRSCRSQPSRTTPCAPRARPSGRRRPACDPARARTPR